MPVRRLKGVLRRLVDAILLLVSRDTAVLTNAIAFNFLLCLFPLILVLATAAARFGGLRGERALSSILGELIPFNQQAFVDSVHGFARMARGFEALSLALIVWGSSGIFIPVEMILNRVWGGRQNRNFWWSRGIAFLMTVAGGILALASIALTIWVRVYGRDWPLLRTYAAKGAAFVLTFTLFLLIYRIIPEARVQTRVAAKAAGWAALIWEALKYAFVVKLAQMNLQAFYGPLAFAVSLVLWAYVSSLALVLGALMSPVKVARAGRPA